MKLELHLLNEMIVSEADKTLYTLGLFDCLHKYGDSQVSGGYFLNLMIWRDLDIYLELGNI